MDRVCSECLQVKIVFKDTERFGMLICHDCFRKRYKGHKKPLSKDPDRKLTIADLKRAWEKK